MIIFYRSSIHLLPMLRGFISLHLQLECELTMAVNNRYIIRWLLLSIMLISCMMEGICAAPALKESPLKASKTLSFERLFDHETIHIPYIDNSHVEVEEECDVQPFLTDKKSSRRKRYYINNNSQNSSYTSRFLQIQYNQEFYIPLRQNKTGIYMQQHAFLPAYYSFLSRYTPF